MLARTLAVLALSGAYADTSGYAPAGNGAGNATSVRVGDGVPGVKCAEGAADLAPLLAVTLEPDIATWQRSGSAAYTMADWQALVRSGADRFNGERLVLIHNNSWYYFEHALASAVVTPRGATPETTVEHVSSWVTATQWWFEHAVSSWNMTFPGALRGAGLRRACLG